MEIGEEKLDAIREIAHIGAGNASKSLSEMTDQKIEVGFPEVNKYKAEEIPSILGRKNEIFSSITLELYTEIGDEEDSLGRMTLILDYESAKNLAEIMTGQETGEEKLTDMEASALKEAGNIIGGNSLGASSELLDIDVFESTPFMQTDLLGPIMEGLILDMVDENDELIVFKTEFKSEEEINAYFVMLFNKKGYNMFLDKIGPDIDIED